MLVQRVLSALVLIPIVLLAVKLGGLYFLALVTVVALLASYEFYGLLRTGGHQPSRVAGLALVLALMAAAYVPRQEIGRFGIAAVLMGMMICAVLRRNVQGFLVNWALTLVGALYVGGLLGHLISLRGLARGCELIILTCAVTWVCDTGAYFVGSRWGRHGFFTHVSPRKTWEGALAGFFTGTLAAVIVGPYAGLVLWQSLSLGALLVVGLTFGDLAESLVKRQIGVKDSGALIPGHGGMLDRVDSLLYAGTIVYYFAIWVARAG